MFIATSIVSQLYMRYKVQPVNARRGNVRKYEKTEGCTVTQKYEQKK